MHTFYHFLPYAIALIHIAGVLTAIDALYWTTSSQGAIAWGISLITFPYAALPLYAIFGRRRFKEYRERTIRFARAHIQDFDALRARFQSFIAESPPIEPAQERAFEAIAQSSFTGGNKIQLLIDGEATFEEIFAAIDAAKKYILVEFFIIRDDDLGTRLQQKLITRAKAGVQVCLIYDKIGSKALAARYVGEMRDAGVEVQSFGALKRFDDLFTLNLRNHRKIIVVDGEVAFVGGHNVGEEYLGKSKAFGHWRDTHVRVEGPLLLPIQSVYFLDWYWATGKSLKVEWIKANRAGAQDALVVASGPTDKRERCALFFLAAINSAKSRIWISSPYFVPDEGTLRALQLAALRGVDVRILLPNKPDHYMVWLASFSFIPDVCSYGARVFRYQKGFLHQKALLVDSDCAAVGTANLDNRSFRLNFEITILVADRTFAEQTAAMLEQDFQNSKEERLVDFDTLPLRRKLLSKFARLFAPVL